MSERMQEIGNHVLWLCGHLLFTLVLDLALFGGYHAYSWYQTQLPVSIDISQLNVEEKTQLANMLVEDGTSVPRKHQ